jgi:hypothetical protein
MIRVTEPLSGECQRCWSDAALLALIDPVSDHLMAVLCRPCHRMYEGRTLAELAAMLRHPSGYHRR